ncbi:MAG: hypothetical protein V1838_02820, partial [Patescibacteria group bacterium]
MLIVIFVSALLSMLVVSVFISTNRAYRVSRVGVELQTEVGRIQNLLLRDIRGAESVSNYPEIDPIFQSDADTLVLR